MTAQKRELQTVLYERLFEDLLVSAPDTLSMDFLKRLPKFRCIFHDSFDRLDTVPFDKKTKQDHKRYSLANDAQLGKNSFQNTTDYEYTEMSNAPLQIGVKSNSYAYNRVTSKKKNRTIRFIDTKRTDYGFMFSRSMNTKADSKIAFGILDIDNFFYIRATKSDIAVYQVKNGRHSRLKKMKNTEGRIFFCLIEKDVLYVYADYHYLGQLKLNGVGESTLCGLLFMGKEQSEIDDFAIYYLDQFYDNHIDRLIEEADVPERYAHFGCEKGMISYDRKHICNSRFSLRFELNYYNNWEQHKIGGSRRSEFCPNAVTAAPLDSWICSFGVYFPGKGDGDEYYVDDKLDELFWQMHAPSNINMLSPNVALYLKDGIIRFEVLSRSELRHDRENVKSNLDFGLSGDIAKLVDVKTEDTQLTEIEKGVWHHFTIYVKEGYSEAHLPRSVVYLDGKKVIDWSIPNMQNCGKPWSYMQMGIYKWPWAKPFINSDVKRRVLYMDNIVYLK